MKAEVLSVTQGSVEVFPVRLRMPVVKQIEAKAVDYSANRHGFDDVRCQVDASDRKVKEECTSLEFLLLMMSWRQ